MAILNSSGLVTSSGANTPNLVYSGTQQWGNLVQQYGTSIDGVDFTGSVLNQTVEYYLAPTADSTTVSLSFQDTGGNTENIRYHNKINYTSASTYNYSDNATSINLTVNRSMGYTSSVTNANAEYGMYLRIYVSAFSFWSGFKNFPRFHVEYFYIANNNATYHGFVNGGPNALGSTSLNRQLWTPVITTNNNVYAFTGLPLL